MKRIIPIALALIINSAIAQNPSQNISNDIPGSINQFGIELYKQLSSTKGNTFFSPFSISTAMAMTYAGARGNTEQEMARVMHFDSDQSLFHNEYKQYLDKIFTNKKGVKLTTANSLWAQKDYTFLDSFFNITEEYYNAPVHLVDYTSDNEREKTRETINKWVEGKTNNKIKDLLQPSDLEPLTRLVLTNAIYFFGNWEKPFDSKLTEPNTFYSDQGLEIQAPFMKHKEDYKYYENDQIQYLEIPYTSSQISMAIILPKETEGLAEIEEKLDKISLNQWMTKATIQKVNILIPKFKTSFRTSLNKALSDMGIKEAFTEDADFSGMTGGKDLMISNVIHQAFIEVNETGTEAAAATAVVMRMKSAFAAEEMFFNANHPFIFIIKDNETNSILFMGRIINPEK